MSQTEVSSCDVLGSQLRSHALLVISLEHRWRDVGETDPQKYNTQAGPSVGSVESGLVTGKKPKDSGLPKGL